MVKKKSIRIGYLQITDHLILGIASHIDNKKFSQLNVKPILFNNWNNLRDALKKGKIEGAFILTPLAMQLKSQGVDLKLILLGHRDGSVFITSKKLSIRYAKDLKNKTIAIPHKFSKQAILLQKILATAKLEYGKNVQIKEVPPSNMVQELASGKIDGFIVAEPFGSQAEEQNIGKVLVLSRKLQKHHTCCSLVMKSSVVREQKKAIQEFTNSLVNAGSFMHTHPKKAAEIGEQFLNQSHSVLHRVLSEKERRVTAWDLFPLKNEFEDIEREMIMDAHLTKKKIDINKFVDTQFAKKAYHSAAIKRKTKKERVLILKKVFLPIIVFILLISTWQLLASLSTMPSALFPSPIDVFNGAFESFKQGILFEHIGISLFRVFFGFFLASILAIPLGLLLGTYIHLRMAFDPLMQILRPISPIAWIPLAIMWFGIGNKPAIFIIFITSFFPVLIATASAIKNIDPIIIKYARNFGTSNFDLLKKVILPASFPFIFVGLRISLGFAWVIIVAAEMVGMRSGLGFMILDARNYLRTDLIIAGMIIIGLIGLGLDRAMSYIERRIKRKWALKEAIGEL